MHKIIFILLSLFLISSCGNSKKIGKLNGESKISSKDYPYIDAFHKGVRLKAQRRFNEAKEQFQFCLTQRQDDDAVYYALSQIELYNDNPQKSAEYIEKAEAIDPNNIWYSQELAYMYYEFKQFDKSAHYFKKLVENNPENPEWLFGYAETLMKNGQPAKAVETLDNLEVQMGKSPQLSLQKYGLLMESKQEEKALEELLSIQKEYPLEPQIIATLVDHYYRTKQQEKAEEMLIKLVKADPSNGRAHLALADTYMRSNQVEKAYTHFTKAFQSDNLDAKLKLQVISSLLKSKQKNDPQIANLLGVLKEKYPENHFVMNALGDYEYNHNVELENALNYFKKSVKNEPNQFDIWNKVVLLNYQLGKMEDLYKDSKTALELFPTVSSFYLLNGVGSNQTKRHQEALQSLQAGIEFATNSGMKAEFLAQIGEAHFGLQEISEGKKKYQKAMQLDAPNLMLKNNFAYRLAHLKTDMDLATSLIEQVLKKKTTPQYLDTKGFVEFQKGNYSEAKRLFQRAISEGGIDDGVIHEHLGDAFFKLNDHSSAIDAWKEAQKLGGNSELLKKKISDKKYYEKLP